MRLVVFGATGGTGTEVVRGALAAGHDVTAVVRDPARFPDVDGAETFTADVMDSNAIAPAITGSDAVVSALGPRSIREPTSVCTDGIRAIAEAMAAVGVRRIVAISAATVTSEGDGPFTRALVKPLMRRILRHPRADSVAMEEHLRGADIDWTVLRPPRLTNDAPTGRYRTASGKNVSGGFTLSRGDLAEALLAALSDPSTHRVALGVAR